VARHPLCTLSSQMSWSAAGEASRLLSLCALSSQMPWSAAGEAGRLLSLSALSSHMPRSSTGKAGLLLHLTLGALSSNVTRSAASKTGLHLSLCTLSSDMPHLSTSKTRRRRALGSNVAWSAAGITRRLSGLSVTLTLRFCHPGFVCNRSFTKTSQRAVSLLVAELTNCIGVGVGATLSGSMGCFAAIVTHFLGCFSL